MCLCVRGVRCPFNPQFKFYNILEFTVFSFCPLSRNNVCVCVRTCVCCVCMCVPVCACARALMIVAMYINNN